MSSADPAAAGQARATRSLELPAEPTSPARARRLVREALSDAGREEWLDACELATTEVVSNAVLHAHTGCTVTVRVRPDAVRVEVRDASPVIPVQRDYDEHATTGRGMALVAALTTGHGLSDVGPSGKTVWFEVSGRADDRSEEALVDAWSEASWDLDELLAPPAADPQQATVVLLGLPPTLWLAARQHHDALVRELVLHLAEHPDAAVDVAATDRARSTISTAVAARVDAAQAAGLARRPLPDGHPSPLDAVPAPLDLELCVPAELGPAFALMQDTLDAAERLASEGRLLARPGLPEIIAVRDWACEQVLAQLAGVAASPWPGTHQERFETAVHGRAGDPGTAGWDVASVTGSARGVVAADEANRIVAVSPQLAVLTGWDVDDLVGRRVVTLIPPALREAHVAGFTRHLTTGEAHVLDVPLTLPVLRRDGTEVTCTFLVQRRATAAGRAVYLAWIEPVA